MKSFFLPLLFWSAPFFLVGETATLFRAKKIQVTPSLFYQPGEILVERGKIQAVGNSVKIPQGCKIVEWTDSEIYPGLISPGSSLGLAEITLGIAALLSDVAALRVVVGVLYVVFATAMWRAISVGAESCGCFGRVDVPPTWLHVFGNLTLAVCSFGAVAGRSPLEVMEDQPAAGVGFVAAVGVLAGLELVVFTALPDALEARKSARAKGS